MGIGVGFEPAGREGVENFDDIWHRNDSAEAEGGDLTICRPSLAKNAG